MPMLQGSFVMEPDMMQVCLAYTTSVSVSIMISIFNCYDNDDDGDDNDKRP